MLGARWDGSGTDFALASAHAEIVELCLFDGPDAPVESERVELARRADGVFHTRLAVGPGQLYGYRVHGAWAPDEGLRFNARKLLVDPYARALTGALRWDRALFGDNGLDSAPHMPRARVVDPHFEWAGDRPPAIPWSRTVLYEVHVKGMTALHPDVPPAQRGRYLGLCAPPVLDHLRALGVTTLSLLPVAHSAPDPHLAGLGLANYWGYNTLGWFAPDARFASADRGEQLDEFRTMVRALHRAGFELLVDVVYNHTPEGDSKGPLYSLRGIDNPTYYRLLPGTPAEYEDFSGCGNTLDLRQPRTRALVLDSLRAWVEELHVDGFRFDLAPALDRESGFFAELVADPVLSRVKLVAEPWDARPDGYRVGRFPRPFAEWNDRYRDAARRFWRGDPIGVGELATRLGGSEDLFGSGARSPQASVNFATCHDGFTLEDWVSYAHKHNEANLEGNRDGARESFSANWGVEGPTTDRAVVRVRERTKRNVIATLGFSLGVPMLSHGDELSRTQGGNNNAYCHDDPTTWLDWSLDERRARFLRFVQRAFALRRATPELARETFLADRDVTWLRADGTPLRTADWRDAEQRVLGMQLGAALLLANASAKSALFQLPEAPAGTRWRARLSSACEKPSRSRNTRVRVPAHGCLWLGAEPERAA